MTKFQFDSHQEFQLAAIAAVVDLFDGQPNDIEQITGYFKDNIMGVAEEVGAIGNNLVLDNATLLANLQAVQDRNGLEVSQHLFDEKLDFDIDMETGTGKTYVYLRTIFELAQKYSFTKFIILVPSVAIREGVNTSIKLMRQHFRGLYPAFPFDSTIYRGDKAEEVQGFATSTNVQIMIMTIDAIRGDKNTRIIHQYRDRLNGLRPIDYLKATRPVLIMDEPQNMESILSQSAIGELDPVFTLRYSATHEQQRNLVYRLDPVDAHDLGLVKQIVVADVAQHGSDAVPYLKLIDVKNTPKWSTKIELACRMKDGTIQRKTKSARQHQELSQVSNNPAYDGWRINEMRITNGIEPACVEVTNYGLLQEGESIGGASHAIYKEMIRETVREHLRKEVMLRKQGIKVLSLFFVDKVASFLGDGVSNQDANGDFVKWFDEVFIEERNKNKQYHDLLPQDPRELRKAYFSQLKSKGKTSFVDSSGSTVKDDDAYELIMKEKERLLDEAEPVRFIFSHSALREGWDNPNVFQICTLREMGGEMQRRQTLGRGLRLPVKKTDKGFERIADRGIATLTVIANESYQTFAQRLQNEYLEAGVSIGLVRHNEFSKLWRLEENGKETDNICGYQWSKMVFDHLENVGFIKEGKATSKFLPDSIGFTLHLSESIQPYEVAIIQRMREASIEKYVKPVSKRKKRTFNKELYATDDFEKFWNTISQKTTYRVSIERQKLLDKIVAAIQDAPSVQPLRIDVTRAGIKVLRGGAKGEELGARRANINGNYPLPDIINELQKSTSLTRETLIDILIECKKLSEFIGNPNDFIAMVQRSIQQELSRIIVEGIQYEKIAGFIYELRELQNDGLDEKERFLDQLYCVQNKQKTDFDFVPYDSDVEYKFAGLLDSREDVKLFMKLPTKFKIPTPVGDYNPDWAIIKRENGEDKIYMIRETKSTQHDDKLRPSELAKLKSAKKHFEEIGVDYERSTPDRWCL